MAEAKDFHELPRQPDELLKEGLATINGKLLQQALAFEAEDFIDQLLRSMKPNMIDMLKDDIADLKDGGVEETISKDAQQKVLNLFNTFLQKV